MDENTSINHLISSKPDTTCNNCIQCYVLHHTLVNPIFHDIYETYSLPQHCSFAPFATKPPNVKCRRTIPQNINSAFAFHITKNAQRIFYNTSFQSILFRWEDIVRRPPYKYFDRIWHLQSPPQYFMDHWMQKKLPLFFFFLCFSFPY